MTEDEAVNLITEHLKGLFPKACPQCNRRYESLSDFYRQTTPVGKPVSYDLEAGDLQPQKPLGAVAVSNCRCGAPIALTSGGMPLFHYWSLLLWAKSETRRRSISVGNLLTHLRAEVRRRVIAQAAQDGARSAGSPSNSPSRSAGIG